jgi:hypothetical protein
MALSREENEMLTRVGKGTPGGEMLRRYWHPVGFANELKNRPVKRRLLGEDLVLFRDDKGRAGLLGLYCTHRGTSLEFGHVEDGGLRCCYRGVAQLTPGGGNHHAEIPKGESHPGARTKGIDRLLSQG